MLHVVGATNDGGTGAVDQASETPGDRSDSIFEPSLSPPTRLVGPNPLWDAFNGSGPFSAGQTVGAYVLLELIGSGGMGEVWRARHATDGWIVALKLIRPAASPRPDDLLNEFELAAGMRPHDGIPRVRDAGVVAVDSGPPWPYFAMDLIPGALPLTEYARHNALDCRSRLDMFVRACEAVEHLHRHGLMHLDIKPQNILVDDHGRVFVTDFGLARPLWGWFGGPLGGTPGYMSLEHCEAQIERIDERADVWSLAVVLFELMTGQRPYQVNRRMSRAEVLSVLEQPPPPLAASGSTDDWTIRRLLARLDPITRRGLAPRRADRFKEVSQLREAVGGAARPRPGDRPHLVALFALSVVAALSIGTGWLLAGPALSLWPQPLGWFASAMPSPHRAPPSTGRLPDVSIVAFDTATAEGVAGRTGLESFVPGDRRSYRAMHAATIPRLVEAGARVIAFDVFFEAPSEHDEVLAAAIRAAQESGVPVVLAAEYWQLDELGRPSITEEIWGAGPQWGGVTTSTLAGGEEVVTLCVERGKVNIMPSFVIAAYAAYRQPGLGHEFAWDGEAIAVRSYNASPERPDQRRYVHPVDRVVPTHHSMFATAGLSSYGLQEGDREFVLHVEVPHDECIAASSVRYERLWTENPFDLRGLIGGRIALIVDVERDKRLSRSNVAVGVFFGGAMQSLIAGSTPRWAGWEDVLLLVLGGVAGAAAGLLGRRRSVKFETSERARASAEAVSEARIRFRSRIWGAAVVFVSVAILALGFVLVTWLVQWVQAVRLYPIPAIVAIAVAGGMGFAMLTFLRIPGAERSPRGSIAI